MILASATVANDYLPAPSASSSCSSGRLIESRSASELGAAPWRYFLLPQLNTVEKLSQLPNNWDGYGSSKTTPLIAAKAHRMLIAFYDKFYREGKFAEPFIAMNEDGEFTFEWWKEERKLTLYIGEHGSRFIKSWGPNIFEEMEDGSLPDSGEEVPDELWDWVGG